MSKFKMLATDYDETIATKGKLTSSAEQALLLAKEAGYLLSIVTGRGFDSLLYACPQIEMFDSVVAENGAILYFPSTGKLEFLANSPPLEFLGQLMKNGVPFHQDRVVTAVYSQYAEKVNAVIDEFKFPLQIIPHKNRPLIVPTGIDKAKGLEKALLHFDITSDQVIAIGDAENDLQLFDICGFKVAVGNAQDVLKEKANWVATKVHGDGVSEFINEYLLAS